MNRVTLIGHLGADTQLKYSSSGEAIANLNIATNEHYRDKGGNKQTTTQWHRVVIFGKLAEIASKHLTKGSHVLVEGKLTTRKYFDTKDNVDRWIGEVVVSGYQGILQMLDKKDDQVQTQPQDPKLTVPESNISNTSMEDDDDLPF
ncbi:Single-stranded DNA-binding protein [uncultured Gammaproteobacteria bacterium]|uniref:single-stranded DNA-binding protein n=1 Tax=Bathymodiolus heckerae thiotrophic gill symbiont TaxID=1052212 RepID=UPI0010B0DB87|nr:single-stranded DNA-binding protein [Bathymodiolus heckerae thiotrophic gill symbiont]CAC9527300.1 Single-stranded DNA-binding protein [uncultured Gammaproteobacteria bacterium]CAC9588120.1 Single-stranded DNA-binding protein [uncultured Gammaproteobacteria bacterium]CAC9959093.1 Single-stranded DNA-binding protein [uncultured Gammaproteobacteria bacterium]SHN89514.1 Single-stranded DNA-binding protein [Bathymodiolus heckerae thiotrophic gill symbiont]